MNSGNPIVDDILKNGYLNEHIFGYSSIFYKNLKITENDISMDDETIALFAEGRKTLGLIHNHHHPK